MRRLVIAHVMLMVGLAVAVGGELSAVRTAQARSEMSRDGGTIPMEVALQVNGTTVALSGKGECTFTDAGTLYERPASSWTATIESGERYVNFASWRVTPGGEMMNLGVLIGNTMHKVSTVKVGAQGTPLGAGQWTFTRTGAGGTFTISATADTGAKISGRVTCSAFGKPEDNG
jgi:hypothetical protein